MKQILILALLFIGSQSYGQLKTTEIKDLEPKEEYSNIKVIPLHSDPNSSVFLIYVKLAVKKHKHQFHTEVVTVLDGKGMMYMGGETFPISKGDHIIIPPNTAHAVVTTGKTPLKVLSVQSPEFMGHDRVFVDD
jgi:mannose-6-phosphate isomerase-like protein (cupin superfamily)